MTDAHYQRGTMRKDGKLYYVDGVARRPKAYRRPEPKVGRNDPCPCGSGKM